VALALLAAACSDDADDTVVGEPSEAGDTGDAGDGHGELTISITAPADGATVEPGFEVEVDPSVDVGEPATGRHHVHIYYDGNRSDGQYDIVYDVDEPHAAGQDLSPGEHSVEAVIANADHSLTDASAEVTVTVAEGGAGGGGGGTTTTAGDDPYDY
jgi:hypothetical protein